MLANGDIVTHRPTWTGEYLLPWKLLSLACGIALLVLGSFVDKAPDWDVHISLIMAVLTYLSAPWNLRLFLELRWRLWPAALFATWFSVDGCYCLYWHFRNPLTLEYMRAANFPASLSLYGIYGVVWLYRGSLRELLGETRTRFRLKQK